VASTALITEPGEHETVSDLSVFANPDAQTAGVSPSAPTEKDARMEKSDEAGDDTVLAGPASLLARKTSSGASAIIDITKNADARNRSALK
jgi:hypothetical protein